MSDWIKWTHYDDGTDDVIVEKCNDSGKEGRKRGRPSTNFDKKAYQRQYMADKRQAEKLGVSVREYRASEAKGRMK